MGATRQNLRARPKILIKLSEHQVKQSERNFSQKKNMFSTLKCKGAKNSYGAKFAGLTQNSEKIIGTSNQPIRTNIFPKKKFV
jgi:hypothetical protein